MSRRFSALAFCTCAFALTVPIEAVSSQSLNNATRNQITAEYLAADDAYKAKKYAIAWGKLEKVRQLNPGAAIPTAQDLRVRVLIAQKRWEEASIELRRLQNLDLSGSTTILKALSSYDAKISSELERAAVEDAEKRRRIAQKEKDRYDLLVARAAATNDLDEAYRLLGRDQDGRISAALRDRKFCRPLRETKQDGPNPPLVIEYEYNEFGMVTKRGETRFEYTLFTRRNGWVWKKRTISSSGMESLEEWKYFGNSGRPSEYIIEEDGVKTRWRYSFFQRDGKVKYSRERLDAQGNGTRHWVIHEYNLEKNRLREKLEQMVEANDRFVYSYDLAGRIVEIINIDQLARFRKKRDWNRNFTDVQEGSGTVTFEYDGGRRPVMRKWLPPGWISDPPLKKSTTTYQYDSNGCMAQSNQTLVGRDGTKQLITTSYDMATFRVMDTIALDR